MAIKTYQDAIDFWYGRINYEQRGMPADMADLKLDRMRALLQRLGNPERRLRIIHIAGSKGKGSTAAMLASILQEAGYRPGLFTSPHLSRVEERCQVDGAPISPAELTVLMQEIEAAVREIEPHEKMPPTFFEVVTALGLLHFVRRRVDWAVLEVGLGGRFDSTNVCTPAVSIITSISYDHTQQLGDTLASIAQEKAGIIKPGRPVVSGVIDEEARRVIEKAAESRKALLIQIGQDFNYLYEPAWIDAGDSRPPMVSIRTRRRHWPKMQMALLGKHQALNAAVTVAAIEELRRQGAVISDEAARLGLSSVQWPARMEILSRRPLVILDCAHNVASVQALVDTLRTSFPPCRRNLIFAASRDKDLPGMMKVLAPHFDRAYFTRYTSSPRSASPEELKNLWQLAGGSGGECCPNPPSAWEAACAAAKADEMICITGSVFLAGEMRSCLPGTTPSISLLQPWSLQAFGQPRR